MKYYTPPKWFVQMCETKQLYVDDHGHLTICGSPFVGKTEAVKKLAKKHGVKVENLKWPTPKSWYDFGGLPTHQSKFEPLPISAATKATINLIKKTQKNRRKNVK